MKKHHQHEVFTYQNRVLTNPNRVFTHQTIYQHTEEQVLTFGTYGACSSNKCHINAAKLEHMGVS
jgi:hypothetical protein